MTDPQMRDPDAGGAGAEFVDTPDRSRPEPPPADAGPGPGARRDVHGTPMTDDDTDVPADSPLRPNTTY